MVLCACGCGEIIENPKYNHKLKQYQKYIHGHNCRGKKYPPEYGERISKKLTGKKQPWNAGDNNPAKRPEVREKISKTEMGKIVSEETIEKLRISHLGKKQSEETKLKRSKKMKGKNNPFFGKHHTEASKNSNAEKHKGCISSPLSSRGIRSYYDSPLQGRICFRSSYELAYARYLDSQKILWYYEIETFDLGNDTYTPDFFLPQFEKFIEIKGYMRPESQSKIDKFLEQYSWDLEILYGNDLIKLGIEL